MMVKTEITACGFKINTDQDWSFKKNYELYFRIKKYDVPLFMCGGEGEGLGKARILLSGCGGQRITF